MKIEIIGKSDISEDSIVELVTTINHRLGVKDEHAILEIIFATKDEIKKYNSTYRKINKPTDVLSFPQISIGKDKPIIGSIVISKEIAEERGETIEELIEHGYLHLLGFDHEIDQAEWNKILEKVHEQI